MPLNDTDVSHPEAEGPSPLHGAHAPGPGAGRHRPRLTILAKLFFAFAAPTLVLFAVFATLAYEVLRSDLDAELGTRLSAVAAAAAGQLSGKYVVDLAPGDEADRGYRNTLRKLQTARQDTGVARMYLFTRTFESRGDTDERVVIGTPYFQAELDRHELERVFREGKAVSSVLFEGADGKLYKAGYAPVRASAYTDEEIVLALGVEAPATYFARLDELRRTLIVYGAVLVLVVLVISVVVAALLTRPIRDLVSAAERIGRGDLKAPVVRTSWDEIGFLAETMDQMRRDVGARDERMQLMLAGIAHEVRNPLGGIELYAGILRDELEYGDERREHVDRIEKELGYLKSVVNDFLEYARRPPPELGEVELGELVSDVVDLARAEAEAGSVPIAVDITPTMARVDAGQFRRAVLNLVRNAVQASAGIEGGSVRVAVFQSDAGPCVEVQNHGRPIPEDIRDRLYDPFFTTKEKGTGLGLAFVREIVSDHHGCISLVSEGGDTVFRIELLQ